MSGTPFVVYGNAFVLATHVVEDGPSYLGQLLLQTKRHIPGYAELLDDEAQAVGLATARLSRALKTCIDAEKVYVVTFAEVVPHLHTFLTSRYAGTPPEYWRMNIDRWPDAPRLDLLCIVLFRAETGAHQGEARDLPSGHVGVSSLLDNVPAILVHTKAVADPEPVVHHRDF